MAVIHSTYASMKMSRSKGIISIRRRSTIRRRSGGGGNN
jgi:hypothetical protein